jgi:hypothetical protein
MSKYPKPEHETLNQDALKKIFDSSLFYTETEVEEQAPCIIVEEPNFDSTVSSIGNIATVVGKPKAGKTFVVTAIAAAVLNNSKCLKFIGKMPEDKKTVLFIDTEQSKRNCKNLLLRLSKMTGTPDQHPANLIYIRLRGKEPQIIVQIVEYAIQNITDLGFIIIDGIKDLVYSINDEHEATKIASKLLDWSEQKAIHILTVIHQNKMDLNTRGHIGTELENKSESVISVEKDSRDKGLIVVKGKLMRDQEFEPFAFRIIDGLPELSEYDAKTEIKKSRKPEEIDDQTHLNALSFIFPNYNNCSKRDFWKLIQDTFGKSNIKIADNTARDFTNYYLDNAFILNNGTESKSKLILNNGFKVR